MKVWGLLSKTDETRGLTFVLDDDWKLVLRYRDCDLARFDPSYYTLSELLDEVEGLLRFMPNYPKSAPCLRETKDVSIQELSIRALIQCNWN